MSNMDNYLNQITQDIPEDELLSVQEAQENGYIGLWKGKRAEVRAKTSYAAQQALVSVFQKQAGRKKVKGFDITVKLAEKDGKQVVHNATEELVSEASITTIKDGGSTWNLKQVHISTISPGDAIYHEKKLRTVSKNDIKRGVNGITIFGDSYNLGNKKVLKGTVKMEPRK